MTDTAERCLVLYNKLGNLVQNERSLDMEVGVEWDASAGDVCDI